MNGIHTMLQIQAFLIKLDLSLLHVSIILLAIANNRQYNHYILPQVLHTGAGILKYFTPVRDLCSALHLMRSSSGFLQKTSYQCKTYQHLVPVGGESLYNLMQISVCNSICVH